jgi:hypothetical protein
MTQVVAIAPFANGDNLRHGREVSSDPDTFDPALSCAGEKNGGTEKCSVRVLRMAATLSAVAARP